MDWKLLPLAPPPANERVLAEILDGGQAFRWSGIKVAGVAPQRRPESALGGNAHHLWSGLWADCAVDVRWHSAGIEWRSPIIQNRESKIENSIRRYFDADRDYDDVTDRLPWRSDPHLARCLEEFRGLRLLRQPFGETLLGFLCSATKQIVQIKQMVALLAERHGTPVGPVSCTGRSGDGGCKTPALQARALPTWELLARVPEAELRKCLLGFRAKYIHETALFLAGHPGWLEETERMPYAEAKARLCLLPGVGEKVADCVLLFGAGKLEAFPVDVWIIKVMESRYGLTGWKPAQIAHFGRTHFGKYAGVAQQYLFAYERMDGRKKSQESQKKTSTSALA